jgi:hypothetical protein
MFHCWWCCIRIMSIAVNFIFIFFWELLCTCNHFKISSTFSIVDNFINWNNNKLVFYAWLKWCGMRIKYPFTFAHGTFERFASLIGIYIQWKKSRTMGCHVQYWTTFTPSCTCPLNHVKLKLSWLVGEIWSLKTSPNIYLMIHGFNTFGPIISNLVHELTLNPLLLFHHVMHIPKY